MDPDNFRSTQLKEGRKQFGHIGKLILGQENVSNTNAPVPGACLVVRPLL